MMKVCYSELDGPEGLSCRLEAAGHAGFAPAGQDIVCAGASTLMQALVYLLAGEENAHADAWEEPDGPRLAVQADAPCAAWVQGAFELAKAGFTLLAERYPDNIRFADLSRRGEQSMMDLQMFAEEAAPAAPALSPAQARQAVASGTMEPGVKTAQPVPEAKPDPEPTEPETPQPELPRPAVPPLPLQARNAVRELHARWAAEEADLRRSQPEFRLPSGPLRREPAPCGTGRGAGRGAAHPAAGRPPRRKRHPPRWCGHGAPGCGQHDPRPARSFGAPCAARCADRTVNPTRERKNV